MAAWKPDISALTSNEAINQFFDVEVDVKLGVHKNEEITNLMPEEWTILL